MTLLRYVLSEEQTTAHLLLFTLSLFDRERSYVGKFYYYDMHRFGVTVVDYS